MKASIKVSPKVIIEADGETQADIFRQLAALQETFSAYDKCGKCGCEDLKLIARKDAEDNEYFELQCVKCWAKFSFGQNKAPKGYIYPRRFENAKQSAMKGALEPKAKLPDGGWLRWDKEKESYY